jgi:hypothetical protein
MESCSLLLPTSPVCFQLSTPLLCASFQYVINCSVFGGSFWGHQSSQGAMLVYPSGVWGISAWCLALTCLFCQMSPKQFLSWHLAEQQPSVFSV